MIFPVAGLSGKRGKSFPFYICCPHEETFWFLHRKFIQIKCLNDRLCFSIYLNKRLFFYIFAVTKKQLWLKNACPGKKNRLKRI